MPLMFHENPMKRERPPLDTPDRTLPALLALAVSGSLLQPWAACFTGAFVTPEAQK